MREPRESVVATVPSLHGVLVCYAEKSKDLRQDTDGPDNGLFLSANTTCGLTPTPSSFLYFLHHRSSLQHHSIRTLPGSVCRCGDLPYPP